jgi:hypothetical protein
MLEEQIRTAAGIDPEEQLSLSDVACIKQQLEAEKRFKKQSLSKSDIAFAKIKEALQQCYVEKQKIAYHIAPDEEIDIEDMFCIKQQIDAEQTID